MLDLTGKYISHLSEDEITIFARGKGFALVFDGKHALHDGGLSNDYIRREAHVINLRNFYSGLLPKIFG